MNEILKKRIEKKAIIISQTFYETFDGDSIFSIGKKEGCKDGFLLGAEYALSHQFISVEESLPDYEETVIVMSEDNEYYFCHRSNNPDVDTDKNGFCNYCQEEVLAWMPIPKFNGKEDN